MLIKYIANSIFHKKKDFFPAVAGRNDTIVESVIPHLMRDLIKLYVSAILIITIGAFLAGCSGESGPGTSPIVNNGSGTITGLVLNNANQPFSGASVYLLDTSLNQVGSFAGRTDNRGQYYMTGVPAGDYFISVDGYNGTKPNVSAKPGQTSQAPNIVITSDVNITHLLFADWKLDGAFGDIANYILLSFLLTDSNGKVVQNASPYITNGSSFFRVIYQSGGMYASVLLPERGIYTISSEGATSVTREYFGGNNLSVPQNVRITPDPPIISQPIQISWDPVEGALGYSVEVRNIGLQNLNILLYASSPMNPYTGESTLLPANTTTHEIPAGVLIAPAYYNFYVSAYDSNIDTNIKSYSSKEITKYAQN